MLRRQPALWLTPTPSDSDFLSLPHNKTSQLLWDVFTRRGETGGVELEAQESYAAPEWSPDLQCSWDIRWVNQQVLVTLPQWLHLKEKRDFPPLSMTRPTISQDPRRVDSMSFEFHDGRFQVGCHTCQGALPRQAHLDRLSTVIFDENPVNFACWREWQPG
jgi:hypothetical protein